MGTRRKAILVALIVVGALTLFMCVGATGATQPPQQGVSVSATINATLELTMSTTSVTWNGATAIPGTTVTAPITATINSNKPYALTVTQDRLLTGTGTPQPTIASGNFTFGATIPTGGTYNAPAGTEFGTATRVIEGARGSGLSTTITYSLTVPWDQTPDTYTATHTYTATQP